MRATAVKPLVSLLLLAAAFAHKCIHDQIKDKVAPLKFDPQTQSSNEPVKRLLQNWNWRNIVIYSDFSRSTISGAALDAIKMIFNNHIVPRIQETIKVQGNTVIKPFRSTSCDNLIKAPTVFSTQSTTADLILMVTTVSDNEDYLAYASACQLDQDTGRPNVGMVAINIKYTNITGKQLESFAYTVLHEVHHILIMSPDLFKNFYQVTASPTRSVTVQSRNGTTTQLLVVTPSVVSFGKSHFGCSSFPGVPLENQGGSGSAGTHWEKIFLGNEIMTSQMTGKPVYSQFTLGLMQDSGWYNVDMTKAEPLQWGKGKGCNFYDYSCSTQYPEYCSRPTTGVISTYYYCSEDFTSKLYCLQTDFTDNCYIKEYMSNYMCNEANPDFAQTSLYEVQGQKSRCFVTNFSGKTVPGCYPTSCTSSGVVLTVNGQQVSCTNAGDVVAVGTFKIQCPDPAAMCASFRSQCPNDCSGRGKCMNSGCFCDFFYTGSDCSTSSGCSSSAAVCSLMGQGSSGTGTGTGGNVPTDNPFGSAARSSVVVALLLVAGVMKW